MSEVRNISMSDTGSNVSVDSEREVNEKKWSDKKWARVIIAIVLSTVSYGGMYLLIRFVIPEEKIAWWLVDLLALVMAFLSLAGISTAINEKTEMGKPVFLFTFILFVFFLMGGYSNQVELKTSRTSPKQVLSSSEASISTLGVGTHTFLLKDIGDETGIFQFPEGDVYNYQISSGDYGYKIICMDEPNNPYFGGPKLKLPNKKHLVMNVIATKANQYVRITVR